MFLIPCNGNVMGQSSQKLNIGLIRHNIQTRFPSKQHLSRFLPSRSQSTIPFLIQDDSLPLSFFPSFLRKFDRPSLPKVLYMYDASLY